MARRNRFVWGLALTMGLIAWGPAAPLWAEGGGSEVSGTGSGTGTSPGRTRPRPETNDSSGSGTGPSATGRTGTATTRATAPVAKPPCWKYKQSRIRKVRDVQSKLAGYARKDKLKGLATTLKRLENFEKQLDAMGRTYTGWRSVEFNLIYLQLRCYANQKQDKALRKWARGILQALAVIKERDHALSKQEKWRKAKAEKNPVKTVLAEAEYSDARGDYHRAAKKLPKEIKALFTPLPKRPGG